MKSIRHVNTVVNTTENAMLSTDTSYRIDFTSVNGSISPKHCYYEMDYSFYSFYWPDSLEIWLDHNATYYRSLSKNSNVKCHISYCDPQNIRYKMHPKFWPSHRRIFGILILSIIDLFSISIGNTKSHIATLICIEWHTVKICLTFPLYYPYRQC